MAHYIAMRAFGEPDAFSLDDPALRRGLEPGVVRVSREQVLSMAEPWRPWRAYAAMHVWAATAGL
jgi:3-methyladenine DNA glycosylase/8-oxoguanine DNA glycosylase